MSQTEKIRLNLGCGGRPLEGYINVDMDTLEQMRKRYPDRNFSSNIEIKQYDLLNLPFKDSYVDEIRSEALIEHLSFVDEPKFFYEITRILKPGGKIYISTIDFETSVKQWLAAPDNWKDFFRNDDDAIKNKHWFGNYSYDQNNRWGYLTATLFGNQNGDGQFHTNCYSEKKLKAICTRLGLTVISIEKFQWQGNRDHMLGLHAEKKI